MKQDILPSGHEEDVKKHGEKIAWNSNQRWISERGGIVHVPSYKFVSFNAGPRTCLVKDLSFIQMKIVASSILRNYHVHVVEDHPISPTLSIVLQVKYGLKVQITKRGVEEENS
ncbi:hypothetical protein K1719_022869 [Acacia pycnantha]|nr:hypothetical protein K1719_022869 [Acacia pycnantha]